MHGMLSAAIILIVFALVAAAGGGSTVWLYRAASGPPPSSRPPRETGDDAPEAVAEAWEPLDPSPVVGTEGDDQEPVAAIKGSEPLALSAGAPPPPALPAGSGEPGPESEGARIYVLDRPRRPRS